MSSSRRLWPLHFFFSHSRSPGVGPIAGNHQDRHTNTRGAAACRACCRRFSLSGCGRQFLSARARFGPSFGPPACQTSFPISRKIGWEKRPPGIPSPCGGGGLRSSYFFFIFEHLVFTPYWVYLIPLPPCLAIGRRPNTVRKGGGLGPRAEFFSAQPNA